MSNQQERIKFLYEGNEVRYLSDLPDHDYQELLLHLTEWKRKVLEEVIKHYLKDQAPTVNVDLYWNNPVMNMDD